MPVSCDVVNEERLLRLSLRVCELGGCLVVVVVSLVSRCWRGVGEGRSVGAL